MLPASRGDPERNGRTRPVQNSINDSEEEYNDCGVGDDDAKYKRVNEFIQSLPNMPATKKQTYSPGPAPVLVCEMLAVLVMFMAVTRKK